MARFATSCMVGASKSDAASQFGEQSWFAQATNAKAPTASTAQRARRASSASRSNPATPRASRSAFEPRPWRRARAPWNST